MSDIKWNTSLPNDGDVCLCTVEDIDGNRSVILSSWCEKFLSFRCSLGDYCYVIAWCRLSEVEPYNE